jgi:outer membrane protein OmpA-like peptidoglycan-associated protein
MKHFLLSISLLICFNHFSQSELDGVWQGFIVQNGKTIEQSNPFYLKIETNGGKTSGLSREEIYDTEYYSIGKLYGTVKSNELEWKHVVYQKKVGNSKISWCKLNAKLTFNSSTGYLEGTYTSIDCRNVAGKIVLFRSKAKFSDESISFVSQHARDVLIKDLAEGRSAPAIREKERLNFKFQPIYFDYDKAVIRPSDVPFLNSIVEVVEGHSDLRIKVIGNTDADGSDQYNDELSKRRAEAIISFFVDKGLKRDRIEIQYNGEKKPIDSNETAEGKQRNRRVEFEFI